MGANQLDLADVFGSVANQLQADKTQINAADSGNGNHGDNMASNFQMIASALNGLRGQDVGTQLRQAASLLQNNGKGGTASVYAEGLLQAAQKLQGKTGLTKDDLLPLLQGIVSGVQNKSNVPAGQGSMLDALIPAVTSFANAQRSGQSGGGAIESAMSAALGASRGGSAFSSLLGGNQPATQIQPNPGAVSAGSLLKGLLNSFN